jgi:hypothetical protein
LSSDRGSKTKSRRPSTPGRQGLEQRAPAADGRANVALFA